MDYHQPDNMATHVTFCLLSLIMTINHSFCAGNHHHKHSSHHKVRKLTELGAKRYIDKDKVIRLNEKQQYIANKKLLHRLKHMTQQAALLQQAITPQPLPSEYDQFKSSFLDDILRVRIPGTVGHHEVYRFITGKLKEFGWNVELDEFVDKTPLGDRKFTNIIAKLNPDAERELAIAAHYDSKIIAPDSNGKHFVAATDSAVPCAMMLDFAKYIADNAKKLHYSMKDITPMLLFLDGEEAFVEWTKNDSIYGARHLANVFANKTHHTRSSIKFSQSIDAFILLDLLGMAEPQFYDFYPRTSHLYNRLGQIEFSLHQAGKINNKEPYFVGRTGENLFIEDDHLPFLATGVPILHIIPIPFPDVWHKLSDDETAIDPATVINLLKIFRQFFSEYFHLDE